MPEMDIETAIWLAIWFFLFVKIWLPSLFPPEDQWHRPWNWWEIEKQINNNSKIYNEIDEENYILWNLNLQVKEIENEIDRLDIESSTDFEKEIANNNKIEKLKLKISSLNMKIDKKYRNIDNLNRELKWIY